MKVVFFKKILQCALGFGLCASAVNAADILFSNSVLNVNETGSAGSLWVFSRGDVYSGVSILDLSVGAHGSVQVTGSKQDQLVDALTAVQDGIFTDVLAEHRRTASIYAGPKLGYLLPSFGLDDDGSFLVPSGFFSVDAKGISGGNAVTRMDLPVPDAVSDMDTTAMINAIGGFAVDSLGKRLWLARGAAGLGLYDYSGSNAKKGGYVLNLETCSLDTLKSGYSWKEKKNPYVFDVKFHPETEELWMATSKGLWKRLTDGSVKKVSSILDTARVTGLWIGGDPLQVIAETSAKGKDASVVGGLWRLRKGDKDFSKVEFLDRSGKAVKRNVYDDGDYTVSGVAFLGSSAFVAVSTTLSGKVSGYFKVDSAGVESLEVADGNSWLYGYETGATDRDVRITSICSFPLTKEIRGLALSTFGNGISVSADSGKSWTPILNRAKLDDDLGSVRMVPSVITAGDQSLVSYKVGKNSKITIDVFSYDMRKVRSIVKDAERSADNSRSTNPKEDFWDGIDQFGRPCTMGVYYVRVKDNHGHIGWGKVMTLGGRK